MNGRRRLLAFTDAIPLGFVGSRIPLPGGNVRPLVEHWSRNGKSSLLSLYEMAFSGGLHRGAVLAPGIMPYLTARIYLRL